MELSKFCILLAFLGVPCVMGAEINVTRGDANPGRVYYVAKNGSDTGRGTLDRPYHTIQKSADTLLPGDRVFIMQGVYHEKVIPKNSGSPGKAISYIAFPGHKVIIDPGGEGSGFSILGKHYIELDGLIIRNSGEWGILVEDSTNITIRNTEVSHSRLENIQIRGNCQGILVENCEASHSRNYSGIDIYQYNGGRPRDIVVRKCILHNNRKFAGVSSEQADNLLVESNICYDNKLGIDIGSGKRNIIRRNTVFQCETGIALSSNQGSEVYENIIHHIKNEAIYSYCFGKNNEPHIENKWYRNKIHDCGFGIYESNRDREGKEGLSRGHWFCNNVFWNIGRHSTYREPFYFFGSSGIGLFNNTLYLNEGYDGIRIIEGSGFQIKNNIISIKGDKAPLIIDVNSHTQGVIDYNCYHNRDGPVVTHGNNSITADPLFVDPEIGDFRLKPESPCRNKGEKGVDMGVYEW